MPSAPNQKMKLLYLMKILLEQSDENHPLTVGDLLRALAAYDIKAERKSIYSDLELLRQYGLDIETKQSKTFGYYVASRQTFTDAELIQTAASHLRRRGITVTLPDPLVRLLSRTVDASPVLRAGFPSLTVDRVRELGAERWVVNPSAFESLTQWYAKCTLAQAIASVSVFG